MLRNANNKAVNNKCCSKIFSKPNTHKAHHTVYKKYVHQNDTDN